MVPTKAIRTAPSLVSPNVSPRARNVSSNINNTMNDVPLTGSIPVSPITRTAIAPKRNVVRINTTANITAAAIGNPPIAKIKIIAKNAMIMNIGICINGHSYQPFPSIYSSLFSPENALLISAKILTNVGAIFSNPSRPPPSIAPIAIV